MTWYAAALAQMGREDEAKEMIARHPAAARAAHDALRTLRMFKRTEDREHFAEALRKAGLAADAS